MEFYVVFVLKRVCFLLPSEEPEMRYIILLD